MKTNEQKQTKALRRARKVPAWSSASSVGSVMGVRGGFCMGSCVSAVPRPIPVHVFACACARMRVCVYIGSGCIHVRTRMYVCASVYA